MGGKKIYDRDVIGVEICERIAKGETLTSICKDDHMPERTVIYAWERDDEGFKQRLAHARDVGYDVIAESTLAIADDGTNDWMEENAKDNPGYRLNGEAVQRSKLRVWTRQQLLAKWNPRKYGDRQAIDLNGKLQITDKSDAEILAELAALGVNIAHTPPTGGDDDGSDLV